MSAGKLLIVGGGGHGRSLLDAAASSGQWQIVGLVDPGHAAGESLDGAPYLGGDDILPRLAGTCQAIIGVGQLTSAARRRALYDHLLALGFSLATVVAKTAYVSPHARLEAGTAVLHGAVVNAGARIGVNCIINSQALIEHDAIIGDHCHVATRAVVNGGTQVGSGCFLGSGSVCREGLSLGEDCVIAMGSLVTKSVAAKTFWKGTRAC